MAAAPVPLAAECTGLSPQTHLRAQVAADIRSVFNAPNLAEAERLLAQLLGKYADSAPQLASWAEENLPEGLTVFGFPPSHWRRLCTSNCVERLNRETRRRSRVATLFPNEASCLRLVTAVILEISEEWQTGRIYLRLDQNRLLTHMELEAPLCSTSNSSRVVAWQR